jgi:hypothetical protein
MAQYTDWRAWARKMEQRVEQLRPAFRAGTTEATDILHAEAKLRMNQDIYSKPEDVGSFSYKREKAGGSFITEQSGKRAVNAKGNKKWRRTGNLRRSETRKVLSDTEGMVENDAAYALPRHDLGLSPGNPRAIKGSKRKSERIAPWRKDAEAATRKRRFEAYRKHLFSALK